MVKDFLRESLSLDLQTFRSIHHGRPAGYEVATMSRLKSFMTVVRMSSASENFGQLYPFLHDRTGATTGTELSYAILYECLNTVRSLNSKVEHDKVYGVIGIFSKICGKDIDDLLRPVYGLTVQEVFTRVTWLLLRELPNISVLLLVEDDSMERMQGLPSWVPDWTRAITNNSLASMLSPSSNASLLPDAYQGYREKTYSLLILHGGFFDTIAGFADSPQISEAGDMARRDKGPIVSLGSAFNVCMNGPVASSHGQSTWDMLWGALIANRTSSLPNFPVASDCFVHYITEAFAIYKATFGTDDSYNRTLLRLQQFQELNNIKKPTKFIIDFVAAMHEDDVHVAEAEFIMKGHLPFSMLSGELSVRRRLFRTREGHLGLGPLSMKNDDQIWLMDGAYYPFLLRSTPDKDVFTFVGDVYLHGHMNGEMLRGNLRDRFRHVTIK